MTHAPYYCTFLLLKSQSLTHPAGVLGHDNIGNDQRGHTLNNGHGTGHDTGIAAALGLGDGLGETEEGRVRAHAVSVFREVDVADGGDKGDNVNTIGFPEPLLNNGIYRSI